MRGRPRGRRRTTVPDNSAFMVAAYVVAGVLYTGYALWLWRRGKKGS